MHFSLSQSGSENAPSVRLKTDGEEHTGLFGSTFITLKSQSLVAINSRSISDFRHPENLCLPFFVPRPLRRERQFLPVNPEKYMDLRLQP